MLKYLLRVQGHQVAGSLWAQLPFDWTAMSVRRRHLGWFLAFAMLAMLLPVSSAQAVGSAISGTVTGPEGSILREIRVNLYALDDTSDTWEVTDSAETNANGSYSFAVAEGTYRLGFLTGTRYASEYAFDARTVESATDIIVGPDETEVVDAQLGYGGVIEGRATDSYGDGIETLDIVVYENVEGSWVRVEDVETGSDGRYRVTGLESGTYRLQSRNRSAFADTFYRNATTIEDAEDVEVTFGEATSGIDLQPAEKGRFSGQVTDAEGEALSGVGVALYEHAQDEWTVVRETVTGASGSYRIHAPHTGSYRIWFGDSPFQDKNQYIEEFYEDSPTLEGADDVFVVAHQETSNINAQIERLPVDPDPEPTDPPEEPEPPTCTIGDPDTTNGQRLRGTAGADVICGGKGNDVISALGGDDIVLGGSGNDRINGGSGNDELLGGNGNDTIAAAAGDDTLEGDAGRDTLSAGSGNDELDGGSDNDKLYGSTNNDRLDGGPGTDSLNGGFGTDDCLDDEYDRLGSCETFTDEPE